MSDVPTPVVASLKARLADKRGALKRSDAAINNLSQLLVAAINGETHMAVSDAVRVCEAMRQAHQLICSEVQGLEERLAKEIRDEALRLHREARDKQLRSHVQRAFLRSASGTKEGTSR